MLIFPAERSVKNIMGVYGSYFSLINESLAGTIGTEIRAVMSSKDVFEYWVKCCKQKLPKTYKNQNISDEEYPMVKELLISVLSENDYEEYKKAFEKLCNYCKIPSEGCIITKYKIGRTKVKNKNYLILEYANNNVRINIPNGCRLYHITQAPDIKELEPSFRGKSAKGYLYNKKRVYFTIKKEMPKLSADINPTVKIHKYVSKENIRTAFVDPLLWAPTQGAIYIETDRPIEVEEIGVKPKDLAYLNLESKNETPQFTSLEEFCTYYGLIPVDEDTEITESVASAIGSKVRAIKDTKEIKKAWQTIAEKFTNHKWLQKPVNEEQKKKLEKAYETMKKEKVPYPIYKQAFNTIAKFFGLTTDDIIIENLQFGKDDRNKDLDVVKIRYSKGKQKVIIPNGTKLLHVSPIKFIKELIPTFKSKTVGKYFYPNKRCFFTLSKQIDVNKAGLENQKKLFKYTPKENIQVAYIDPTYTDYNSGSVYVATNFPIPVENFDKDQKK
jgi:hypothetical protein